MTQSVSFGPFCLYALGMGLDEVLVREGVAASLNEIREVLREAERNGGRPVSALVRHGIVAEDILADILAKAAGTIVFDLHQVDPEAAIHLPAAIARRHQALPVGGPTAGKLRVAFDNPLDMHAREAVEQACGFAVVAVVSTLQSLTEAIDRAYRRRPITQVVLGRSTDIPKESTKKLEVPTEDLGTHPTHRLEEEATPEQRHQALLLALIERGVLTRVEYNDALKRLLSGGRSG